MHIDIGQIINSTITVNEIAATITALSQNQKYYFLTNFKPTIDYTSPSNFINNFNREFKFRYFLDYKRMVYSHHLDATICAACSLTIKPDKRSKCGKKLISHSLSGTTRRKRQQVMTKYIYHLTAMIDADQTLQSVSKPEEHIDNRYDIIKQQNIVRNRHIIKCVTETILFCG